MSPDLPISTILRQRIHAGNILFRAQDNISEVIELGDLDLLIEEVSKKIEQVLQSLVIDTANDHNTHDTCRRVAKMFILEVFQGRYLKQPELSVVSKSSATSELQIIGPITVSGVCSHHLCPVIGRLWIGILPDESKSSISPSKYVRLTNWVMSRPQIQEEAVTQLAEIIENHISLSGLAIVMNADHSCIQWRGSNDYESRKTNSVMRGLFLSNSNLRKEFLSLIAMEQK
jgi:GTP cyclohydrolase I